jgi:NADH-quinone oxidoreductase subunit M
LPVNQFPLLSLLILTPLAGGILVLSLGEPRRLAARRLALSIAMLTLALAVVVGVRFHPDAAGMQLVEKHAWIRSLAVDYHLGVDGLGLVLVVLSALLVPMAMLASQGITVRQPLYLGLVLLLEAGLLGTFTALNFSTGFCSGS